MGNGILSEHFLPTDICILAFQIRLVGATVPCGIYKNGVNVKYPG